VGIFWAMQASSVSTVACCGLKNGGLIRGRGRGFLFTTT
jgi:hypothetical protein